MVLGGEVIIIHDADEDAKVWNYVWANCSGDAHIHVVETENNTQTVAEISCWDIFTR